MTIQIMRCRCSVAALSVALWFAGMPAFAQSSANETTLFQARIKEAASNLADRPAFKNLSAADREKLMDFIVGNMLFVILHELGHAAITEMRLPVLGRPEAPPTRLRPSG